MSEAYKFDRSRPLIIGDDMKADDGSIWFEGKRWQRTNELRQRNHGRGTGLELEQRIACVETGEKIWAHVPIVFSHP